MNKQLNWKEINALHQLFNEGKTNMKIAKHPYVNSLIERRYLEFKRGSNKILKANSTYQDKYIEEQLEESYTRYYNFLSENELLFPYTSLSEFEIKKLIHLKQSSGITDELRQNILEGKESRKGVSNKYFKSAKHIKKDSFLEKAVLKILDIDAFPQNENQGFYRVPCKKPKCIILCENIYFLTLSIAPENDVELWCAGGNNTAPLERLPKIDYPIYYLCDWDFHGLSIYERIHSIIENIADRDSSIHLITPNGKKEGVKQTSDNHRSQWDNKLQLSGLNRFLYKDDQIELIQQLVKNNEWIEEESNNLIDIIAKF
jgi:hypothetical protein